MSYDIKLVENEKTLTLDKDHLLTGGTYALGGTRKCWLNVTYNYAPIFKRVLGEEGIRSIYGMSGKESQILLAKAASRLQDDDSQDYWEPTEGNVKKALVNLLILAILKPEGIWTGD